jgi:hypothetical protein
MIKQMTSRGRLGRRSTMISEPRVMDIASLLKLRRYFMLAEPRTKSEARFWKHFRGAAFCFQANVASLGIC